MVREQLTDLTNQKNSIVTSIRIKQGNGLFIPSLHDIFNQGSANKDKLKILDVQSIIESIEIKLREAEIILHTYFGIEYDKAIIIHNSLIGQKVIEAEFNYGTRVIKKKIEIIDPNMYKEIIDVKFQLFILTIASLYENMVRLIETLIKKKVVFGDRNPHQSIPLKTLISYWDNLIELDYRKSDDFYAWLILHRAYLDKYLAQINFLRNSFIHGYSINLEKNYIHNEYVIKNYDDSNSGFRPPVGGGLITELVINTFVAHVLNNTQLLTVSLLNLLKRKLSHHWTKLPI